MRIILEKIRKTDTFVTSLMPFDPFRAVVTACCLIAFIVAASAATGVDRREIGLEELRDGLEQPEGELRSMVEDLERSLPGGDDKPFNEYLNAEWLLERATTVVGTNEPDLQKAFCDGTRQSWKSRSLAADYSGTHFRFLRAHSLGGRSGLLFRAGGEGGALNFCMLTLARGADGKCAVDDIYVVGLSEFVSGTLRRGYITLLNSLEPAGEEGRRATAYLEHLPKIVQINTALRQKEFSRVLTLSHALPGTVRHERGILLMRLEAAEHVSMPERSKVLAEWLTQFSDEMTLPLKFADFHIAQGRMSDAERVLRALDQKLGGDSYLKLRVGEVRMLQRHADQLAAARKSSRAPTTPVARTPAATN
ncbi:MAG: hypothetical protein ACR2OZ_09550 [Verrucomicrobiales bacterium]